MYTVNKKKGTNHSLCRYRHGSSRVYHSLCLIVASLVCFPFAAVMAKAATTYYVDPSTGDMNNGGSFDSPWKTVQEVFDNGLIGTTVLAGDTILLRSGYHGEINYSNAHNSNYITIAAQEGHAPKLKRIRLSSATKWIFRGLTVSPQFAPGSYSNVGNIIDISSTNSHDIIIENCTIFSIEDAYDWTTASQWTSSPKASTGIFTDSQSGTIRNNIIRNVWHGISACNANNLLIEYNEIDHFSEDGLKSGGDNTTIQYNTIKNSLRLTGHPDGMQFHRAGPIIQNNIIRGNVVIEKEPSVTHPLVKRGLEGIVNFDNGSANWIVENNVVLVQHYHGITLSGGPTINARVINNTIVDPTDEYSIWISCGSSSQDCVVRNCLAKNLPSPEASRNLVVDHCIDIDHYGPDALFVGYQNNDVRLKPVSPAIDAGSGLEAPATDILGTPRPQGSGYDIGAYEYVPSDSTTPSIPQNLQAQAVGEYRIDLSWDESTDPESGIHRYNIYRDTILIDSSSSTSYQDTGLESNTSYSYQVSAVNGAGLESERSIADSATTSADTTAPFIVSVNASETSVTILFSETLDSLSAEDTTNYTINNGISVIAASLNIDTVILTTSSHAEGSYILTVTGVEDNSGNTMPETSIDYIYDYGLVGYWMFNETAGLEAEDSSGMGNTATLINGPTWTTQGKFAGGLQFDGADDSVEVPTAGWNADSGTVMLWAKANSFSDDHQYFFGHNVGSWTNTIQLYTDDASGNLDLGLGDSHTRHTNIQDLNTNIWFHIALTWDGTNYVVYVDGGGKASGTYTGLSFLETYADIGNNGYSSDRSEAFSGIIDEVRIYNRALSAAEVSELYDAGNSDPVTHTLVVTAVNGSVTKTPDKASYNHGEEVTLQPEPDTGYSFANWSGDLTGSSNPATIVMDANKSVTANFTITVNTYTLNITADNGSVTKTPDQASYDNGTTVTLQAMANTGYSFAGWSGDASGTSNPTTVVMDGNKSVTANFTINTYNLGITATNGSVAKTPDQASYNHGTTVTLQATPDTGYSFAGWSGDASGTSNPTTVLMDGNKSVTANFTINTYMISASAGSNGQISPDGITQVNYGASQEYTIKADPGYKISDVLVDGSSVGAVTSYIFTNVDADRTIHASFAIDEVDVTAPTVNNLSPQADSIQVPLNRLVTLDITDSGDGVDANSITIKVNGNVVYKGNTAKHSSTNGNCYRTGSKANYRFVYQSEQTFEYDHPISIDVNAMDLAGNPMDTYSYSFKTEMRSFGKNKRVDPQTLKKGRPATVCDSKGDIWATWHVGVTGSRDIYIARLLAEEEYFGDSIKITENTADQCNPVIAAGSDDKLYVAWQDNRRGNWDIYVSIYDGINWSAEIRVTDSNENQINPAIVVDNSNNVHIVWEDDCYGNRDIYTAKSNNGFITTMMAQITSDSSDQFEPAIAADFDNTVYVVWTDTRNDGKNDIYGAASNNGPWTNIPIVTEEESQSSPAIAAEAVGSILHLVWVDDRTTAGDDDIFYAKTNGGLPASPLTGSSIIDDTTGAGQISPVIIATGHTGNDLKVFACWRDERNADADLYAVEIGAGAGTNVFVGDDGTNTDQSEPSIGIDGYGYPYLVWTDERTDICYAGSTFIKPDALASGNISTSSTVTVGTLPNAINSVDDVSAKVPQGAYLCDVKVTISPIKNPPKFSFDRFAGSYEFGPSGMDFLEPVTITIPYKVNGSENVSYKAYWYNSLTNTLSQQGITDIQTIVISPTLHALRFKTTHFSPFVLGGMVVGLDGGGGGGGGCSMSPDNHASIMELLLPYIGLTVAMVILKLRDQRKRKTSIT